MDSLSEAYARRIDYSHSSRVHHPSDSIRSPWLCKWHGIERLPPRIYIRTQELMTVLQALHMSTPSKASPSGFSPPIGLGQTMSTSDASLPENVYGAFLLSTFFSLMWVSIDLRCRIC